MAGDCPVEIALTRFFDHVNELLGSLNGGAGFLMIIIFCIK
jgi:hypothetical protein